MSSLLTGDFPLLRSSPHAIWDERFHSYRFYHKYTSYLPITSITAKDVLAADGVVTSEQDVVPAEIWVPTPSPSLPFPSRSLVFLRGRIILPESNSTDLDSESGDTLPKIFLEIVYIQFRRSLPTTSWSPYIFWDCVYPEATITGKIVEVAEGAGDWTTLVIEGVDELSVGVSRISVL